MPELPDLQVFSRNLNKALQKKKLRHLYLDAAGKTRTSEKALNEVLAGKKLKEVSRLGKQLLFDFGKDAKLTLHLMLHGQLVWMEAGSERPKHCIARLEFPEHTLALTDFQKAAHFALNPEPTKAIDALSDALSTKWLKAQLAGSRSKIKALLMDQQRISGIGNAYADEILWTARIAPGSIAGKIPEKAVTRLAKAIRDVLKNAEKQILKQAPDAISGEVRDFMNVHNHHKKHSPDGAEIQKTTMGGRPTYYTAEQEFFT
ncbi:Fpg/Nei family DNA glycosylase [Niabella sp. CC-SYL272]|uniref:Fpg/Nei family DNA glycosylase n=1 Tax=Niabella agricola TaxID=2891571 RepID=UPI001F44749B|nr:DNA-formamidopyrimidine glycosylase family protein [Niabella agricola]MCF3107604.1 Fpg/Nei family DNA glycosylase [Niabella agricola]